MSRRQIHELDDSKCSDCGEDIIGHAYQAGESTILGGRYYKGPTICKGCLNIRYEEAIADHEAITVEEIPVTDEEVAAIERWLDEGSKTPN